VVVDLSDAQNACITCRRLLVYNYVNDTYFFNFNNTAFSQRKWRRTLLAKWAAAAAAEGFALLIPVFA
jgi:hypothetical protein